MIETPPSAEAHVQIPRRAWVVLATIVPGVFLAVSDSSTVSIAFPSIGDDLNASDEVLSWVLAGYNLSLASFMLVAGRLADRLGRRRVFLWSVGVFTVSSLLCGFAPNVGFLIVFRLLQGVGGSAIFPVSLALVLTEFPPARRSTPVGIWAATAGLGATVGPLIGALLIELFGWRGIFWIDIPVGVAIVLVGRRVLVESYSPRARGHLDLLSVTMGVAGLALLLVALIQGEDWGFADARTLLILCSGLLLLPILVMRSKHHPQPLLDLSLFKIRSFQVAVLATTFSGTAFLGGFLANTLLLQRLWDWPVWKAGLGFMVTPIAYIVFSTLAGIVADRVGHRWLAICGGALCCLSFGLMYWRISPSPDYFADFFPSAYTLGAGAGLAFSSVMGGALADVRRDQLSMGGATVRTIQQVCFSVGLAVVVALISRGNSGYAVSDYYWVWLWLIVLYLSSGLVMALFFPSGTASSREAAASSAPERPPHNHR